MAKLKIVTVLGTRPEIIRLSRVLAMLDEFVDHKIVHTGQNYDYELNEIFFNELGVRKPDYFLGVDTSSLGSVLGNVIIESEKVFLQERPDALLILGDTNSSIAGIMAKRMKIPIYHMEAGNRSFDANVPEEINRKIIDKISDFNLVYTEHARRHLLSEGLPHRRIYLTGSPLNEVLAHYSEDIEASDVLSRIELKPSQYFLVSIHREENVDNPENLKMLLGALENIAQDYNMPVIISTHPRTRKRMEDIEGYQPDSRIVFSRPFGFFDYNKLQKNARCVISDSGTISEESAMLSFPAITVRNAIERPEGLDHGNIIMTGLDADTILNAIDMVVRQFDAGMAVSTPEDYRIDNTAQRVVRLIVGTAKLSNAWDGIDVGPVMDDKAGRS